MNQNRSRCIDGKSAAPLLSAAAIVMLGGCASEPGHISPQASLSGEALYLQLCASCHGENGEGSGPVGPLLKVKVPDLTRIAWRDGGEFPRDDVRRSIDGRLERLAHGSREMPVWGIRFYDLSSNDPSGEQARVTALIDRLVDYLERIQREE